jgi:hypothetical protein
VDFIAAGFEKGLESELVGNSVAFNSEEKAP